MTPEQWQKVCDAVDRAMVMAAAERRIYLDELYAKDTEIAVEVEAMLNQRTLDIDRQLEQAPERVWHQLEQGEQKNQAGITSDSNPVRVSSESELSDVEQRTPNLPDYEILSKIGRGGMGVVYKARHRRLNRIVALKMIITGADTQANIQRFLSEAEAVASFQHPNVVQVFEVGQSEGLPFMALEFVEGGNLEEMLSDKPLPTREAAALVEQVARGMNAAHQAGIVHRDLKPSNILLTKEGTPKVTDFGLAKKVEASDGLTQTGAIMGTPSYMAPEQATGEGKRVVPSADVYALGGILYGSSD